MKTEGQVRIPSGCAIAAMISRDGNKMSGETITNAMKPITDSSSHRKMGTLPHIPVPLPLLPAR